MCDQQTHIVEGDVVVDFEDGNQVGVGRDAEVGADNADGEKNGRKQPHGYQIDKNNTGDGPLNRATAKNGAGLLAGRQEGVGEGKCGLEKERHEHGHEKR